MMPVGLKASTGVLPKGAKGGAPQLLADVEPYIREHFRHSDVDRIVVGVRHNVDFFAISMTDQFAPDCKVFVFRARKRAGLKPQLFALGGMGVCDGGYEKVSRYAEEAIVLWNWAGNKSMLTMAVLTWTGTDYVNLLGDVDLPGVNGRFGFTDLDGDGNKELIITEQRGLDFEEAYTEVHYLTLDSGGRAYRLVNPGSARYKRFQESFNELEDSSPWDWKERH